MGTVVCAMASAQCRALDAEHQSHPPSHEVAGFSPDLRILEPLVRVHVLRRSGPSISCWGVVVLPGLAATAGHCLRDASEVFAASWKALMAVEVHGAVRVDGADIGIFPVPADWPVGRVPQEERTGSWAWATKRTADGSAFSANVSAALVPVSVSARGHDLWTTALGESPCLGDSGGPLFSQTGEILGILSKGALECELPDARNQYVGIARIVASASPTLSR